MSDRELVIQFPKRARVVVVLPSGDGQPPEEAKARTPAAIKLTGDMTPNEKVIVTITYAKN